MSNISIDHDEYAFLEAGLKQRVRALNLFLNDIYNGKKIVRDLIIPEEFIYSSKGYSYFCEGFTPPRNIYAHISTFDLIKGKDGRWYVANDTLTVPSSSPYEGNESKNYTDRLRKTIDYVRQDRHSVMVYSDESDPEYPSLSKLSEESQVHLVNVNDLLVEHERLYMLTSAGRKERVGAVYRTLSDPLLDPIAFNSDSKTGVPHILDIYKKGHLAILNAPGSDLATDKSIYYFIHRIIRYYLGEEPLLLNVPSYLPFSKRDMNYILENFDNLVFKDLSEDSGRSGILGSDMSAEKKEEFIRLLMTFPKRFIAQEAAGYYEQASDKPESYVLRKADLGAYVLMAEQPLVFIK